MKHTLQLISIVFILVSCKLKEVTNDHTTDLSKHLVLSTAWYQQSAEMEASYLQCYTWAKFLLDNKLDTLAKDLPKGVVLDIDETVLDNSPYEAWLIQEGKTYESKSWKEWTDQARAGALPGALDFVNYAKSKGVAVFYISNRKIDELASTMKNLNDLGFPNTDSTHVLLVTDTGDKTKRREIVSSQVKILLFVGDNLTDYSEAFANRGADLGKNMTHETKDSWLFEFIMLPNPMYGEWEKALYGNDFSLSDSIKVQKRLNILKK